MSGQGVYAVFISIHLLMLLSAAGYVSYLRATLRIANGDGGNRQLFRAIRVHANGVENVPVFGLAFWAAVNLQASVAWLVSLSVLFTVARLAHAYGLLCRALRFRQVGAGLTYLCMALCAVQLFILV